ncbi:MAG: DUF1360 domain-containing protein [Chloroflexota bacterium]|jgi:hypothetical protein|nr:DUF1360 domain-containing protein [Chloroflexota bacterium]
MTRDRTGTEGRVLKLSLIGTFLSSAAVAGTRPMHRLPRLGALDLAMLGLASHRIGRMIAFERVAEPLREPFTATVPDETGADDTVVARGRGVRWVLGELLSCPTCVGTWAAMFLYLGLTFVPGPTRVLMSVLAAAGVAEVAYVGVEQLEWSGRAARKAAAPTD